MSSLNWKVEYNPNLNKNIKTQEFDSVVQFDQIIEKGLQTCFYFAGNSFLVGMILFRNRKNWTKTYLLGYGLGMGISYPTLNYDQLNYVQYQKNYQVKHNERIAKLIDNE